MLFLPLNDVQHVREVSGDVAMCPGPDGLVVAVVDEVVSIAVERSTDRCLIEQMCAADLWVVDLLKDVQKG